MKNEQRQYVCNICARVLTKDNSRHNVCWDCIEAESIIVDGLDMHDEGLCGSDPAITALEKVKLLIMKGWTPPN